MAEPKFWKIRGGLPETRGEFPPGAQEPMTAPSDPQDPSRRRFVALTAASAALAAGIACSRKTDRGLVVPYTKKPEEVVPGVANYYASAFQEGAHSYGVLVKTREGRPILVEGNDEDPLAGGKTTFRATADLLGLYDPDRLRGPLDGGAATTWEAALGRLGRGMKEARSAGKGILLLTPALLSPTRRALLAELQRALPTLRVAPFEPAADADGYALERRLRGEALQFQPQYEQARVLLALEADFLGSWGDAPAAIRSFADQRRPAGPGAPMNRLYAFEGAMTLTGSKADHRVPVRPSALAPLVFAVARELLASGLSCPAGFDPAVLAPFRLESWAKDNGADPVLLEALVGDLAAHRGRALVLTGPAVPEAARAGAHLLNLMLRAEGGVLDTARAIPAPALTTFAELESLRGQVAAGAFGVALLWETNPLFASPAHSGWAEALARVPLKARMGLLADETARACDLVLPVNHWLESWNDFDPSADLLRLQQPVVAPLYDTLQAEEVLLKLLASLGPSPATDYHAYLKARWQREVYPAGTPASFDLYWNAALHDGVLRRPATARAPRPVESAVLAAAAQQASASPAGGLELVLYADAKTWDGRYANNGWLQELPDPVTKNTWGNPLSLAPADARRLGVKDGEGLRLQLGDVVVEAPALVQPGQAPGVITLALGYGRSTGSVAAGVGVPAWTAAGAGEHGLWKVGAALAASGRSQPLARTQEHHGIHGRDIVRQWSLDEYALKAGEPREEHDPISMYPDAQFPDHKWGMAIDLSACVGCSGCVVACQSENNVPVVGPEQVRRGREMHWIRVDRYYEGPEEAPRAVHQPMVCQQCDNAPCENVCPVQATNHSPDGLNQMAYNRCVGTRYCANNCPYKVRRFNFFDFTGTVSEPLTLAFNPEVTVRPRGVMEKCTFCIQRIQNARQVAKGEGRPVRDGEIVPACAAACPAKAITFGDLKDPGSAVSRLADSDRGFKVLAELGVRPSVTYLADLKNPAVEGGAHEG